MPVVLEPGTELVMNQQVFFHTDSRIESKTGKFSEERLHNLQQFNQNLYGLGPLFTHRFHHLGGCAKDILLRFFVRLQND
jgi:hypothetical protein